MIHLPQYKNVLQIRLMSAWMINLNIGIVLQVIKPFHDVPANRGSPSFSDDQLQVFAVPLSQACAPNNKTLKIELNKKHSQYTKSSQLSF